MSQVVASIPLDAQLGKHADDEHCSPEKDIQSVVVPEGDKGNSGDNWEEAILASEGDIEVADKPQVEPSMPHSPKSFEPVVVADAPRQIIDYFYPAQCSPSSPDSPDKQKLKPDKHELEEHQGFNSKEACWEHSDRWRAEVLVNLEGY